MPYSLSPSLFSSLPTAGARTSDALGLSNSRSCGCGVCRSCGAAARDGAVLPGEDRIQHPTQSLKEATSTAQASLSELNAPGLSAFHSALLSQSHPRLYQSIFDRLAGLPDKSLAFTTVTKDGQRLYNGDRRNFSVNDQRKWTRTDGKSDGRGATVVTFAFSNDFNLEGVSTDRAKTLFKTALQTWADYAPLDFVEVADPGAGNQVDIYIQDDDIDGRSGTLAYAFFPENGDITFDNGEDWNENTLLETAVHELGHSLGLDHEDDTDAIMNSVLGNRYSGESFLLQDDINGIRSLYGSGPGSVTSLGDGNSQPESIIPVSKDPGQNLVTNSSFEDSPVRDGAYGIYRQIKGWSMISGNGFQVDRRPDAAGKAADGTTWLELDTNGDNATIGQNIDTVTGQDYQLSVSFTDGGRAAYTTKVDVFWDGKRLDTLTGGSKGQWRDFTFNVKGGSRSVSTLAFRAVGPSDNVGGFIDNIVVSEARRSLVSPIDTKLGSVGSTPTMNRNPISSEPNTLLAANIQTGGFSPEPVNGSGLV